MPFPARFLSMMSPESPPTYRNGDSRVAATHTLPELLQNKQKLDSTFTPLQSFALLLLRLLHGPEIL